MTQESQRTKQSSAATKNNIPKARSPRGTSSNPLPGMSTDERISPQSDKQHFEILRLKKEVEYNKRLRHAADQRSFDLEQQLTASRATSSNYLSGYDVAQRGLVEESHALHTRNSALVSQLTMSEAAVKQSTEMQAMLEADLDQVYTERDDLAAILGKYSEELEGLRQMYSSQELRYQQQSLEQQAQLQQYQAQAQAQVDQVQQQQQLQLQQQLRQQQADESSRISLSGIQTQDCVGAVPTNVAGGSGGGDLPGTDNSLHELLDAAQVVSHSDLSRTVSNAEHARR